MKRLHVKLPMMDRFICWGPRCPATCCHVPWQIEVDKATMDRWQELPTEENRALLASTRELVVDGRTRVAFRKVGDDRCIHFRDDRLCALHARYGFDNLSQTCRAYPRVELSTDWQTASAIHLSCPAAVTLLTELGPESPLLAQTPTDVSVEPNDPVAPVLDRWVHRLLALEGFPTGLLLLLIARALERLASLAAQGALTPETLDRLNNQNASQLERELAELEGAVTDRKIPLDPVISGTFWHFIFKAAEKTFRARLPANPAMRTVVEWLGSLNDKEAFAAGEEIHEQVEQLGASLRPKLVPHSRVLRNYLAALFLVYGFPWRPKAGNYIATFFRALVSFSACQLYLRLHADDQETLTTPMVAEAIYQVEHSLGHHERIYHVLEQNPAMLRIGRYAACVTSLG